MERTRVERKIPKAVTANRWMTTPNIKSEIEPAIGIPSTPCTTSLSDKKAAIAITRPLAHIFATMISAGVRGITSKCSIVPCSRSRISAAPVNKTASSVIILTSCITPRNHLDCRFGLNFTRITWDTGDHGAISSPLINSSTSCMIARRI